MRHEAEEARARVEAMSANVEELQKGTAALEAELRSLAKSPKKKAARRSRNLGHFCGQPPNRLASVMSVMRRPKRHLPARLPAKSIGQCADERQ